VKEIALAAQKALGVKPSIVVLEFVCGACNTLDERSAFLPPGEEYTTHVGQLNSLGMLVACNADNVLLVEKVVPGSWAAHEGVKDGDRIELRKSRKDEKGEVGPLVEIDVSSRGDAPARTVKLPDSLPSVLDVELLPGGVGFLRLASFQKSTLGELEEALEALRMRGRLRALIVDLRGNPGGLFPVSVQVAERFLPEGIIVTTQGQVPAFNRTFESHSGMGAVDLPLFVLIDAETASAAEVLAGALKDNQRAVLIGAPTYGKGTIQTVLQLTDGGGMRLTLARFFTPRGQPYNGMGVAPHFLETMRPRELAAEQARATLLMRP
jgi:carboxyl-terminal processing protease